MKNRQSSVWFSGKPNNLGFTLIELLIVVVIVGLLAVIQLAAVSQTQSQSNRAVCRFNLGQLSRAWLMYAEDNNGRLTENHHGGDAAGGANRNSWVAGLQDWTTRSDNTNDLLIADERWAKLARYANRAKELYKCPSDTFLSRTQISAGYLQRVRSYSMNSCMGAGNYKDWYGSSQTIYIKMSDIAKLAPDKAFVLLEEHPDSMNEGCFFVNVTPGVFEWVDLPASSHEGDCHFSFADGHVEFKLWQEPTTLRPVKFVDFSRIPLQSSLDLDWLKERTTTRQAY